MLKRLRHKARDLLDSATGAPWWLREVEDLDEREIAVRWARQAARAVQDPEILMARLEKVERKADAAWSAALPKVVHDLAGSRRPRSFVPWAEAVRRRTSRSHCSHCSREETGEPMTD